MFLLPPMLFGTASLGSTPVLAGSDGLDRIAEFKIQSKRIDSALLKFSGQAHIQIAMAPEVNGAIETSQLNSAMSARQALDILLKNTGLQYAIVGPSTISVAQDVALAPATAATNGYGRSTLSMDADGRNDFGGAASPSESNEDQALNTSEGSQESNSIQQPDGHLSSSNSEAQPATRTTRRVLSTNSEDSTPEIVVSTYRFLAADTSGTTNLPLPIEKVPQAISLVSNDFIKAADLKTLGEIAEYTPGAVNVGNPGNLGFSTKLRGFSAGQALDGIILIGGGLAEPDYAIYDRLELVKGPSSVVYGVGSPGGLVNFVTKSATAQTIDYVSLQVGSWNSFRMEGQVAGSLDSAGRVRAIGVVVRDQGDSFMEAITHEKTTVYGGLNLDLSDSVSAYIHGGYERYVRTNFDGIPTEPDGSSAPVPRSFFIGDENGRLKTSIFHSEGDLTWHATDMLQFNVKGNYEKNVTDGVTAYSSGLQPSGDFSVDAGFYSSSVTNYGIGLSSIYHFDNLGLKESFVSLAALYQNSTNPATFYNHGVGTANLSDGVAAISAAFNAALVGPSVFSGQFNTKAQTTTVSVQSVLKPLDPLSVLLGVSYSKPDAQTFVDGTESDFNMPSQISYRAGLTYEFLKKTNAYISYSESFSPTTLLHCDVVSNSSSSACLRASVLQPLTGRQFEIGLKRSSEDERLLLTGALFQIDEQNLPAYEQTINILDYFAAVGQVRHRGIELQAIGQITRSWQINVGYAYLDPKITRAVVPGTSIQSATVGQMELYLPKNTVSLYSTYTLAESVLRGLTFGVGVRYVSAQHTAYDTDAANVESFGSSIGTKDLPAYMLVDANLGYAWGKWSAQLNAHNVFDRHYLINNYQTLFYGNVIGDPANVAITIRRSF